jgi:hypothetical protein
MWITPKTCVNCCENTFSVYRKKPEISIFSAYVDNVKKGIRKSVYNMKNISYPVLFPQHYFDNLWTTIHKKADQKKTKKRRSMAWN